eukprot:TRINITY_DN916_c0_g1_i3.p1 TRINITY_DN916_c0_g1~~TRINITY_DN916_c0_g1_i3.p1  ORF type:complete len:444 (-),score=67.92 TRINITY_DN916_c0_g1_i3:54-1385(-)
MGSLSVFDVGDEDEFSFDELKLPIKRPTLKRKASFSSSDENDDNSQQEDEDDEQEQEDEKGSVLPIQSKHNIVYVFSEEYLNTCSLLPIHKNRFSLIHTLLEAYQLLDYLTIVPPEPANERQLSEFHNKSYIKYLRNHSSTTISQVANQEFGLEDDCPETFQGIYSYVSMVAGASITAADMLSNDECKIAVNIEGGRHHAKKDQASGYCYINDIVLSILHLLERFSRVLYIDIDIHHGDGVEEAFYTTNKVFTLSFHNYAPGFFPGSGKKDLCGSAKGLGYNLNVPLNDGITDKEYFKIFSSITNKVKEKFQPDVCVLQCGTDGLGGDPLGTWNLTPQCIANCVELVASFDIPLLLLGGGGYAPEKTARTWVHVMKNLVNLNIADDEKKVLISDDIPDHGNLMRYGPDFRLSLPVCHYPNKNTQKSLDDLETYLLEKIDHTPM